MSSASTMLDLLDKAAADSSLYFYVNAQGELGLSPIGSYDYGLYMVGKGDYAPAKVAQYFIEHKNEFDHEVEIAIQSGRKLIEAQTSLDYIVTNGGLDSDSFAILDKKLSNWMHYQPDSIKSMPLNRLIIPGSHDSAAYKLDLAHTIQHADGNWTDPGTWDMISHVSTVGNYLLPVSTIVGNWTITQKESIAEQLQHGIRMFDLRVAFNSADNKFYLTHTFTLGAMKDILQEFKNFMQSHPEEAVIISITPDWAHRSTMGAQQGNMVIAELEEFFSGMLLDKKYKHSATLHTIAEKHTPAIIMFDGAKTVNSCKIWDKAADYIWPNKEESQEVIDKLNLLLPDFYASSHGNFNFTGFYTTPSPEYIMQHLLGGVVADGEIINAQLCDFLKEHMDDFRHITGITGDAVDASFAEQIIALNYIYHH
jgi:hypothetical protein